MLIFGGKCPIKYPFHEIWVWFILNFRWNLYKSSKRFDLTWNAMGNYLVVSLHNIGTPWYSLALSTSQSTVTSMIVFFICGTNKSDDQMLTQSDFPFDFNEYWTCIRWLKICDINPSRIKSCKLKTIYITGPATPPENMSFHRFQWAPCYSSLVFCVCLRWYLFGFILFFFPLVCLSIFIYIFYHILVSSVFIPKVVSTST